MSENIWITKYKPKNSSELIGNKNAIKMIKKWLNDYNKNSNITKPNLIIIGPHGIGKTTIINILLKEVEYNCLNLDFGKVKNNKMINDYINSLLYGNNISNIMNENKKYKNTIIVDDIEMITSTIEKKSIEDLRKKNEKNRYLPIIFISDNQHTKFLAFLKKTCIVVNMYSLYRDDLLELMNKIIKNENIKIYDEFIKNQIIDHIQGDIRRLINVLQDIWQSYNNVNIDENILNEYIYNSNIKEIDIGLFDSATYLFNNFDTIEKSLHLYEMEKSKLPLMIHEHYIDHINNKFIKSKDKLETIKKISDSLSYGDFIEYHIYNDQDWDMQEFHGFYTCSAPSFYLNNCKKIKRNERFRYPDDSNKKSIKCINKKNISNIENNFNNANNYDYIQMNKIIKYLLDNKNIKEIGNKLKGYNLNIAQVDSLLKIDKVLKSKNNALTTKNKRDLESLI